MGPGTIMINLIIDTCVWIDLSKVRLSKLRKKISLLVEQKKARLIVPVIVNEEWNRHKPRLLEEQSQSVKGMIKNARALSEYLNPDSADKLKEILPNEPEELCDKILLAALQDIENLFNDQTTVVLPINDRAKIRAADFALVKKAPFRNKNSMADALIIFSAVEYIMSEGLSNSIFVSSNTQDFASKDKAQINEDLKETFEKCGMKYFSNIGLAINEVEAGIVSTETIEDIETTTIVEGIRDAFRSIQASDRQLIESIDSIWRHSRMSDVLKVADEVNRRIRELGVDPGKISAWDEIGHSANKQEEIMRSLRMAGEFVPESDNEETSPNDKEKESDEPENI